MINNTNWNCFLTKLFKNRNNGRKKNIKTAEEKTITYTKYFNLHRVRGIIRGICLAKPQTQKLEVLKISYCLELQNSHRKNVYFLAYFFKESQHKNKT